jgi:hypothetical protein
MYRASPELLAQARIHGLRQPGLGQRLVAAHGNVVKLYIMDAPLDEGINQNRLLLGGKEALRFGGIERQDALVENAYVLHQRPLERQARLGNHFLDFAKLENDRELPLIDGKHGHGKQGQNAEDE